MKPYSDTQLHRDHCEWNKERASWHDDLRIWEEEIEEAAAKLKRMEAVLAQQKHELQVHAAAIRIYQQRDGQREHALVRCERDGNDERRMLLAHVHQHEIDEHQRQRERHEEIKASQRGLMSELGTLIATADRLPPALRCTDGCSEGRVIR
jgi:hypothetical protein